jgi:hypothetical protein
MIHYQPELALGIPEPQLILASTELLLGVRFLEAGYHFPLSTAEVKDAWSDKSTIPDFHDAIIRHRNTSDQGQLLAGLCFRHGVCQMYVQRHG